MTLDFILNNDNKKYSVVTKIMIPDQTETLFYYKHVKNFSHLGHGKKQGTKSVRSIKVNSGNINK